jgi:YHS domain-containing protein
LAGWESDTLRGIFRSDGNWGLLTKRERKERHSMTKDPVRAMSIDEKKAAATAVFQSKTYHFCSPGCKATFDKDPAKYGKA